VGLEPGGGARADRPKELFDAVEDRAQGNETCIKDAPAAYPQRRAPRDARLYVLKNAADTPGRRDERPSLRSVHHAPIAR
jgi:hypothetical protein